MESTKSHPSSPETGNSGVLSYSSRPDQWYDIAQSADGKSVVVTFPPRKPPEKALRHAWQRAALASAVITAVFAAGIVGLAIHLRMPIGAFAIILIPLGLVFGFFLNREDRRRAESTYRICRQTSQISINVDCIHVQSNGARHNIEIELKPPRPHQVCTSWFLELPTGGDGLPIQPSDSHLTCIVQFVAIKNGRKTHYCIPTISKREAEDVAAMLRTILKSFVSP